MPSCPICTYTAASSQMLVPEVNTVSCPGCGTFEIAEDLVVLLAQHPLTFRQRANATGWLRATGGKRLTTNDHQFLKAIRTPSIPEKAERLMLYIAKSWPDPGQLFGFSFDIIHRPIMSAVNSTESEFIADYCVHKMHWLEGTVSHDQTQGQIMAKVTPDGWAYIASITGRGSQTAFGFVAMHFAEGTHRLREDGIRPAILAAGYDPRLMDEVPTVNHVDDEILAAIQRCRFLVADLSGQRQNVYYEAGFAQGLGKTVIWTCSQDDLVNGANQFDVRQYGFVAWSLLDLPSFQTRLTARIVGLLGPGPLRES